MEEREPGIFDRSPFEAAEAVVRTLVAQCPHFDDEDAVWSAFASSKGQSRKHIEAIRLTRHSIFYYQMQQVYEFAREQVGSHAEADICFLSGKRFMDAWFRAHTDTLVAAALSNPKEFQQTVVGIIRTYLFEYTGDKFTMTEKLSANEIAVTLAQREQVAAYLRQYGLDPVRSFHNALQLIAGTVAGWVQRVVSNYDESRFRLDIDGEQGTLHLPVPQKAVFRYEELTHTLLHYIRELDERQRAELEREQFKGDLVMKSQVMREVWERIKRASRTDETLLLRGESGTGKSFMAKKIHELSARRGKAFVVVGLTSDIGSDNLIQSDLFGHERGAFTGATATKQGLFSLADGGTIFLDEIGDASPELQAKLLRVLESSTFKRLGSTHDMQVDVHVIAATNRNLERMVEERTFREDLYYRLNVIPLELPPLRERPEDIPAMAEVFLAHAVGGGPIKRRLAPGLVARLKDYTWPGNIRELDHALKYAAAMASGEEITLDDFPDALRKWLEGARPAPTAAAEKDRSRDEGPVVDEQKLRRAIRSSEALPANEDRQRHEIPAHIESAKRTWLATLLDEFGGDLQMVARYWDRSSEKTLRKLIRSYGLTDRLTEARRKKRSGLRRF